MPRKTVASLEKKIADLEHLVSGLEAELTGVRDQRDSYIREIERLTVEPPNTYLSYVPSGNVEIDAMTVAYRALETLADEETTARCLVWLHDSLHARFVRED